MATRIRKCSWYFWCEVKWHSNFHPKRIQTLQRKGKFFEQTTLSLCNALSQPSTGRISCKSQYCNSIGAMVTASINSLLILSLWASSRLLFRSPPSMCTTATGQWSDACDWTTSAGLLVIFSCRHFRRSVLIRICRKQKSGLWTLCSVLCPSNHKSPQVTQ